jgi:radical SAM superfamily enzyme YgiQ (UPF0313 family)
MNILFLSPITVPYNALVHLLGDPKFRKDLVLGDDKKNYNKITMPMGILYLGAVIQKSLPDANIDVVDLAKILCEYNNCNDREAISVKRFIHDALKKSLAESYQPTMIGISILFSSAHKTSMDLAEVCREIWPKTPIVLGGVHSTNAVDSILENKAVDYVCKGEAESIIVEMVQKANQGEALDTIQGVISRSKLAESEVNKRALPSSPLINNLDEIPFPAWNLIPMSEYISSGRARRMDNNLHYYAATIITTRGCPFHCTFCSSWTVHGRKMRYRSTENVIKELEILTEKYGVNSIIPEDDLFTVKKPRIIELCNTIHERFQGKLDIQFPNGLSVATLDEDVIETLCKAGISVVNVAIESGSKYTQKHIIKKNCNLERAKKVTKLFYDKGVITRTYFVIGFPGETRELIKESLDYASSLQIDWIFIALAAPLIGSEMYKQLIERGDIDTSYNWDNAFYQERTFDTPEVSAKELKNIMQLANLKMNFFENYNIRTENWDRAITLFINIIDDYPLHLAGLYCLAICYRGKGDEATYEKYMKRCRKLIVNESRNNLAKLHMRLAPDAFPLEFHRIGFEPMIPSLKGKMSTNKTPW